MGELLGKQWQPRDIARLAYETGWQDAQDLVICVAVCLAESQGYDRAYNDNLDANGKVVSRDVGIMQINIPVSQIGTSAEEQLYDVQTNFTRAFKLWTDRGFEPWVAYTSDVYLHDTYIARASRGVGNYLAETLLQSSSDQPHKLTSPVLDYEWRVRDQLRHVTIARHLLGWGERPASVVSSVQGELSKAQLAAKESLPS